MSRGESSTGDGVFSLLAGMGGAVTGLLGWLKSRDGSSTVEVCPSGTEQWWVINGRGGGGGGALATRGGRGVAVTGPLGCLTSRCGPSTVEGVFSIGFKMAAGRTVVLIGLPSIMRSLI